MQIILPPKTERVTRATHASDYNFASPMTDADFRIWYQNATDDQKGEFWAGDKHGSHVAIAEEIDTPRQPGVYFVSDARDGSKRPVSRRYVLEQIGAQLLDVLNESGSLSCGSIVYSTR